MRERAALLVAVASVLILCSVQAAALGSAGFVNKQYLLFQEYVQGDDVIYALQNARAYSLEVVVRELVPGPGHDLPEAAWTTEQRWEPGDTLAVWNLEAGEVAVVPGLRGGSIDKELGTRFRVYANTAPLGSCFVSGMWPRGETLPLAAAAPINAPGYHQYPIWMEMGDLWFESGASFEVDIVIAFDREKVELWRVAEFGSLPGVTVLGARSGRAEVVEAEDRFVLDLSGVNAGANPCRITLSCLAPEVTAPSLACIGGPHIPWKAVLVRPLVPPAN